MLENRVHEELLDKVRITFQSAFKVDPHSIGIDTVPADLSQWDSMGHVTLASCLEQAFGVTLDVDDLMAMENVREICRVLHSKLAKV